MIACIRDIMRGDLPTIVADQSCHEAARRMIQRGVRYLLVVDGAGDLAGMVTDAELRRVICRAAAQALEPDDVLRRVPVRDVMVSPAVCVEADAAPDVAAQLMASRRATAAAVVERGRLVGTVTEHDLLQAAARGRHPEGVADRSAVGPGWAA
jgi:arabinose-5-phosphate isomerase